MDPALVTRSLLTFPNIDPVLIQMGPLAIRWYSLGYVAGILIGWLLARRMVQNERLWSGRAPMTPADIDDFIVWATLGIIIGGRLGFVLFYDPALLWPDPWRVFEVWQGGMSFHGGLIGTTAAMVLFARSRGFDPWRLFDLVACVAPIGIGLVRIANFINAELYGRVTNVPWAMIFPTDPEQLPRHPSQLYEAFVEGLVLFIILRLASHRWLMLKHPRFLTGLFVAGYGAGRTLAEFFRQPDPYMGDGGFLFGTGWLTMGMTLSVPMIIVGLVLMVSAGKAADDAPDSGKGADTV